MFKELETQLNSPARMGLTLDRVRGKFGDFVRPFIDSHYRHDLARRAIIQTAQADFENGVIGKPTLDRLTDSLANERAGKYLDLLGLQMAPKVLDHLGFWTGLGSGIASGDFKFLAASYLASATYKFVATYAFSRKNPELRYKFSYGLAWLPIFEYFAVPADMIRECEAARYMFGHYVRKVRDFFIDEQSLNFLADNLSIGGSGWIR